MFFIGSLRNSRDLFKTTNESIGSDTESGGPEDTVHFRSLSKKYNLLSINSNVNSIRNQQNAIA